MKRLLFIWSIVCLDIMCMSDTTSVSENPVVRAQGLVHAVMGKDVESVNILLTAGVDINKYIPITGSALHYAADGGDERIVKSLLQRGPLVDVSNESGDTPLSLAAYRGHLSIVHILLKNGAHVNKTNKNGQTPLMYTIFDNHVETAQVLIEHGANLEARTRDGATTVLHQAARIGTKEMVELLLKSGAKVNKRDWAGKTALTIARNEKRESITELLIRYGGIEKKREE